MKQACQDESVVFFYFLIFMYVCMYVFVFPRLNPRLSFVIILLYTSDVSEERISRPLQEVPCKNYQ